MRCLLKESAAQKPQQFVGPRLCGTGGRAVTSILERSPCYQSSRDEARSTHANRLGKNSAGQKRQTRSGHHGVESLFTAIYQKANNVPWQLETLPEATCFVGISFFRSDPSKPALKTSLAQAFSGRGKGLVLQGPRTITDRKGNPVPHLSEKEAEVLLTNVLKLFSDYHDTKPRRVVVHKTSKYWPEELGGFRKASSTPPATFPPYQPIPECACPCQSRSLNTMGTPPLTWFARKSLP
jgi:hypothetical protein